MKIKVSTFITVKSLSRRKLFIAIEALLKLTNKYKNLSLNQRSREYLWFVYVQWFILSVLGSTSMTYGYDNFEFDA